jgi:hypothetical protein
MNIDNYEEELEKIFGKEVKKKNYYLKNKEKNDNYQKTYKKNKFKNKGDFSEREYNKYIQQSLVDNFIYNAF